MKEYERIAKESGHKLTHAQRLAIAFGPYSAREKRLIARDFQENPVEDYLFEVRAFQKRYGRFPNEAEDAQLQRKAALPASALNKQVRQQYRKLSKRLKA